MKFQIAAFAVLFSLLMISCRKKDQRHEGIYMGMERIVHSDSNGVYFDSSYQQIVTVEYSWGKYTIQRILNNPDNHVYIDAHRSFYDGFYDDGSTGFGDCVDNDQGTLDCGSSWRYFYATDSLMIEDGGNVGDTTEYRTFRGKRQ